MIQVIYQTWSGARSRSVSTSQKTVFDKLARFGNYVFNLSRRLTFYQVHLVNYFLMQQLSDQSSHMIEIQCIWPPRDGQADLLNFKLSITMKNKDYLNDFECGIVAGDREAS